MAIPSAFQRELRQILRRLRAASGVASVPGGSGKALEAWLLMKLAETARALPSWQVSLRQGDGHPLPAGSAFRFPVGQAGVGASNPNGPSFVLMEHRASSKYRLELHGGLQWMGRSGATHECDVSVVHASIAEALRTHGGGSPRGLPIAAFECKDRTRSGNTDEMRQTLARLFDLALVTRPDPSMSCRMWEGKTNMTWGRRSSKYVSFFARGTFGIVRVGGFHSGADYLGQHYSIHRFGNVYGTSMRSITAITLAFTQTLNTIHEY